MGSVFWGPTGPGILELPGPVSSHRPRLLRCPPPLPLLPRASPDPGEAAALAHLSREGGAKLSQERRVFLTPREAKDNLCRWGQHGPRSSTRPQISGKNHSWSFQGRLEATELVNQVCESVYVCSMIFAAGGYICVNHTIFFFLHSLLIKDTFRIKTMSRIFCLHSV